MKRKEFIHTSLGLAATAAISASPLGAFSRSMEKKITILHTNDWHSRIEPFPFDGGSLQGQGGASARAAMIEKIRAEVEHVLLLDAGDIFQGTPYFNFFNGELEYKLMSAMGYDCVTLGNHDFDNGLEGITRQLPLADFSFVNANYDFRGTLLESHVKPYKIFNKGRIKVGVFGLGIELKGLVPEKLYGGILYNDPVPVANAIASQLKKSEQCDLIICLSHLGYEYKTNKVSDLVLARSTQDIDLIIGGHTHTFLPEPIREKNAIGKEVLVNQVGWAGVRLGRIDFTLYPLTDKGYEHTSLSYSIENI